MNSIYEFKSLFVALHRMMIGAQDPLHSPESPDHIVPRTFCMRDSPLVAVLFHVVSRRVVA